MAKMKIRKRQRPLTFSQAVYVDDLTERVLDRLLEFKFRSDITNYVLQRAQTDWRSTEYVLRDSPVNALGVILRSYDRSPSGPLVEQKISAETASEYLGAFPLEAAAINYVFTIVELYGDMVVQRTNKKFFKGKRIHTNWHHKVYGDANTERHDVQVRMAKAFGEPLLVNGENIDSSVVLKLIELKRARNAFAHQGDERHRFDVLFGYAIDVICEMYFLLREDQSILVASPFASDLDPYDDPFEEARRDKEILEEIEDDGE